MRTTAAVALVVALVVAAPAVGGPDALSIAKRALREAGKPAAVEYVYTAASEPVGDGRERYTVRCPRGKLAVSANAEFPAEYVDVQGRRAVVVGEGRGDFGPASGVTVVCLEGRRVR